MSLDYSGRVRLFEEVRDRPFSIPDNSCYVKNARLVRGFGKEGMKARLMVADFRWSDLFNYIIQKDPSARQRITELQAYTHNDQTLHVYARVKIDKAGTSDGYVDLDATWDIGLTGRVPVCEWNGISNGRIIPVRKYYTEEESETMLTDLKKFEEMMKDLDEHQEYFAELNALFQSLRR